MNETMNNKELVASGHEFARHMSSDTPIIDIAKMVTRLASQLDVTTAALRHAYAQFDSQSLELKAAVAAEIDWEKAMMQAVGSDGIGDVVSAIEKLKTDGAALANENAALINAAKNGIVEVHDLIIDGGRTNLGTRNVIVSLNVETPATSKFIAEQQANGVEKFSSDIGLEYQQLEPELKPGSAQAKALKNIVFRAVSFAKKLRDEVKP